MSRAVLLLLVGTAAAFVGASVAKGNALPFPSGIDVTSTGCWLLTIRSGKAAGIAVFNSVPAA